MENTGRKKCKLVVACIGTPLNPLDRVGLELAKKLAQKGLKVVECPYGLELCAHRIRMLNPDILVIVDAALGIPPGGIEVLKPEELLSKSVDWIPTTHALSLPLLFKYAKTLAKEVYVLLVGVTNSLKAIEHSIFKRLNTLPCTKQ